LSEVAGLLGPDVTLIHCTNLDDGSLDAIAATGAAVAMTPASEMANGIGSPPIQRIVDRKIRPGLGIDDERTSPGDLFAQMRAAISLQHATYFDLKLAGKAGLPNLLTTREVIRFATVYGARAAGLGDSVGVIAPGRRADIVLLRTDRPNIFPVNDPIGAVVWGMDTSNVDWVFVAGKAVKANGELQGDLQRAQGLAAAAQQRVTPTPATFAGVAPGGAA
jgi:cytosine/adenosine deaminase-related metal-dependent hydrolase